MLSREEYNLTFNTDLSEEAFKKIMGTPVDIFNDDLVSIVAVDHLGNKREFATVTRCKDCKWFDKIGCAIQIVDESDKPHEDDFCSFAERRTDGLD